VSGELVSSELRVKNLRAKIREMFRLTTRQLTTHNFQKRRKGRFSSNKKRQLANVCRENRAPSMSAFRAITLRMTVYRASVKFLFAN